jgi:hypothetical protein
MIVHFSVSNPIKNINHVFHGSLNTLELNLEIYSQGQEKQANQSFFISQLYV